MSEREDNICIAEIAEEAERPNDMFEAMKKVASLDTELSDKERNLLREAFKNKINPILYSLRTMDICSRKEYLQDQWESILKYLKDLRKDLRHVCNDVHGVLDNHVIPHISSVESEVFYYKMKGDFYRYAAEFLKDEEKNEAVKNSLDVYTKATELATANLLATHPIRLELALDFSIFYYEIMDDDKMAVSHAKRAFNEGVKDCDSLNEESCLIMQTLRDNLEFWVSDIEHAEKERQGIKLL